MPMRFICLDPRKAKKRWIKTMLGAAGTIRFLALAPIGFASYDIAELRAEEALRTSTKQPKTQIIRRAKLWMLKRQYAGCRALFERRSDTVAVVWNGLNGTRRIFADAAKDAGNKILFFELSPFANRITIDPRGVNFANSLPRKAAPYIKWAAQHTDATDTTQVLRETIRQRRPRSIPHPTGNDTAFALSGPFVFVPLQVPGDSQLRVYGGAFKTVDVFVETILKYASNCPEGWHIRIKEHPTATPFVSDAINMSGVKNVVLDNVTDTFEQVRKSKLILTVNSSVGLEAMYFDKPVAACGDCFWAIDGIATTAVDANAISQILADPQSVSFDPRARSAFLAYLDKCYYPALSAPENAAISTRIAGPDENGFWGEPPNSPAISDSSNTVATKNSSSTLAA